MTGQNLASPGGSVVAFAQAVRTTAFSVPNNIGTNIPFDTDVSLTRASMHDASASAQALTGTVQKTAASAAVVGTGTKFNTELAVGDTITVPGGAVETGVVTAITNDTNLTVGANFANSASGQSATVDARTRFTVPEDGVYLLGFWVPFASSATGIRAATVQVGLGSSLKLLSQDLRTAVGGGNRTHLAGSTQAKLTAGTVAVLQVLQSSTANLNVDFYYPPSFGPHLSVNWVSAG